MPVVHWCEDKTKVAEVFALAASGEPYREIAERFGTSAGAIAGVIHHYGPWQRPRQQRAAARRQAARDRIAAFLNECYVLGPGYRTSKQDLLADWQRWCAAMGPPGARSAAHFGILLRLVVPAIRISGKRAQWYVGLQHRMAEQDSAIKLLRNAVLICRAANLDRTAIISVVDAEIGAETVAPE